MERMLEFAGNHLFLVSLFFALLTLLIWNLFGGLLSGIMRVEPAEMTRLMNRDHALVVDVRKEEDFRAGHVLHAIKGAGEGPQQAPDRVLRQRRHLADYGTPPEGPGV